MPNRAGSAAVGGGTANDDDGGAWYEIGNEENYSAVSAGGPASLTPVSATASAASKSRGVPAFNFSFAMGGWLMFYSFGVAKCLMDHGLHKVLPMRQRAIGISAGALAATALVLEADTDKIVHLAKTSLIPRAHAARFFGFVYGMFFIGKFLKESMRGCFPVEKVPGHTCPPGRLMVVMASVLGWNSVRAEEFKDGEDLLDALQCSCACFPLAMPHTFRGKRCFDGFFSEGASAPTLDEEEAGGLPTVTISPLYASSASIRPSRYVPLSWMALPPRDPGAIDWLYDLGYRDALFWMAKEGIQHTCSHVSRLSRISEKKSRAAAAAIASRAGKSCCASLGDALRTGVSALEDSDSSDSGSEDDEEDCGHPSCRKINQISSLPSTATAEILTTSNGGKSDGDNEQGSRQQPPISMPSSTSGGGADRQDNTEGTRRENSEGARAGEGGGGGGGGGGLGSTNQEEGPFYVRPSFALSKCHMRPRRKRHPDLDEPTFVPSLEKFVGHGSYHAAADFAFTIFFNAVWRPAAALLLLADLVARLLASSCRAFAKDLRPLLWWLTPTLLLGGGALPEEHRPSRLEGLAAVLAITAAVSLRGGSGGQNWQETGRCFRALFEYRHVLVSTLVPWVARRREGDRRGERR